MLKKNQQKENEEKMEIQKVKNIDQNEKDEIRMEINKEIQML